jgi:hypothetical protein
VRARLVRFPSKRDDGRKRGDGDLHVFLPLSPARAPRPPF